MQVGATAEFNDGTRCTKLLSFLPNFLEFETSCANSSGVCDAEWLLMNSELLLVCCDPAQKVRYESSTINLQ